MTSFRNVRSSGDGGNARAARQLSDEAFFHRVIDFTGKAYEAEGITFVASPSTSDFFGLDADPRDPALERERRALEERVCRDIAEALAQPENHRHRETLALDGCLTVTLGERVRLLAVEPSLEMGAELRAARFRSARGLRLSRWQADADAEALEALGDRLPLHHHAGQLPTLQRAVIAQAAFLRSPAGLRPGRLRANYIAGLFEQLATLSRLPVARRRS
jgi:hypothetical protein